MEKNNYRLKSDWKKHFKKIEDAIQLIEETKKKIDPSRVTLEYVYPTQNLYGRELFVVKLASPNLKFHKAKYAPGGDSIFLGYELTHKYSAEWTVRVEGESSWYNFDHLFDMIDWAERMSSGETIILREPLSDNYLRQKVW